MLIITHSGLYYLVILKLVIGSGVSKQITFKLLVDQSDLADVEDFVGRL